MKNVTEIVLQYTNKEITLEEANKALTEADAGFFLKPNAATGWTEEEKKAGFIYNDDPVEVLPDRPDMSRRTDLAGLAVIQKTKAGQYEVSYDADGYAFRATRMK